MNLKFAVGFWLKMRMEKMTQIFFGQMDFPEFLKDPEKKTPIIPHFPEFYNISPTWWIFLK